MKKTLFNLKSAVLGLGMLFAVNTNAATFTAITSGNWSSASTWGGTAPTSLVSGDNIIISSGVTVNLDMDVTFTSGLLFANTFSVAGTLTGTANALFVTQGSLVGNGMIMVKRLSFTNTGSSAFTGTMNVGTLSNASSALSFAAYASVSDSLVLESGALNLTGSSNLMLMTNSTIRVNDGSISLLSGGVFNTSNNHNVMYVGTSKTTGLELSGSAVQNVWISMNNNNQSVSLGNDFVVNGNLNFSNGKMNLNGKKLVLMGDLNMSSSNAFVSNSSSDLTVMGSGTLTSGLMFDSGSSMHDMTIDRSNGSVKLMSNLGIHGRLNLINGNYSLESGSNLTMNSGSTIHVESGSMSMNSGNFTGTSSYNVEYMGSNGSTSGMELSGSGLNDVTVGYTSGSTHMTLGSNATVNGSLNMMGGSIDLNGKNLTLNGSMAQGTMNSTFIGNSSSDLVLNLTSTSNAMLNFDQSNNNVHKLILNLSSSSNSSVMVGSGMTVNDELRFIKGKLVLGTNGDLMIASTGTITGYDATNYVVTTANGTTTTGGHLVMNIAAGASDYMTFPVGTHQNYSPAYIQQTSAGTTGNFMVMATNEFMSAGDNGTDLSNTMSVVRRTWFIESASGVNVNMNLKLGWTAASEVNGFNRNNAILRHFINNNWDMGTVTSATAGANGTYEISRSGFTSLSPFGVTDNSTTVGIRQNVASSVNVELYPNPAKDAISVKSPNASANCKYELIDITGRTILSVSNCDMVNKFDVSKLEKGYYFVKVTDTENNISGTKRFIKE